MSPEQINDCKYNEQSDIWSLGCIIYELAALVPPFKAQNHLSLAMKIKSGTFERIPQRYSEDLQRVIQWMLTQSSQNRPTVDDLMSLPQLNLRVLEKKLQERSSRLRRKEEELCQMEQALKQRESAVTLREVQLKEKEAMIEVMLGKLQEMQLEELSTNKKESGISTGSLHKHLASTDASYMAGSGNKLKESSNLLNSK